MFLEKLILQSVCESKNCLNAIECFGKKGKVKPSILVLQYLVSEAYLIYQENLPKFPQNPQLIVDEYIYYAIRTLHKQRYKMTKPNLEQSGDGKLQFYF